MAFRDAPYKNPKLPIPQRVEDLMQRMTLEEKVAQLGCMVVVQDNVPNMAQNLRNGIGQISDNVSQATAASNAKTAMRIQHFLVNETRLGIPAIIHCEALQGVTHAEATVFPAAIALAASWEPEVVVTMGEIIRRQCKAIGVRQVLSPVMDVCRDSRWGRINETYGESPTLCAAMSAAFTKSVQSEDLKDGVLCTGKHFLGYGFSEGACNMHECHIPYRTLREVYAKPFQAAITKAGLLGMMNAYNTIDGEPIVSSKRLLTDLLREEMDFKGIVVSDYMSLERLVNPNNVAKNVGDAACQALEAGLDQECPNFVGYAQPLIDAAAADKERYMNYIDRSVKRVLDIKFKLGLFEEPFINEKDVYDHYNIPEFERLSYEAAKKTMVLVKNEDGALPLSKGLRKIAVIGPLADDIRALLSGYTLPAQLELHASRKPRREGTHIAASDLISEEITPHSENVIVGEDPCTNEKMKKMYPSSESLVEALVRTYPDIAFTTTAGCDVQGEDTSGFQAAEKLAREADVVVLALGGRSGWGKKNTVGEGLDSCKLELTGMQHELAQLVFDANPRTVVVHIDGRPLSDNMIDKRAGAILEAWCPGPHGALAIAETLFGDNVPGGKMPVSTPLCVGQVPVYAEHLQGSGYDPKRGLVLNHKGYFDGTNRPLRYFGHGLSYTKFEYSNLKIDSTTIDSGDRLRFCVDVKNVGSLKGDEVVQAYIRDLVASVCRPVKELVGFKRVSLKPDETKTITFEMHLSQIAFLDKDMKWKVEAGEVRLMIGSSSEDIRLQECFFIKHDAHVKGTTRGFWADTKVG